MSSALGGVLWIPYGIFEMLQPWGTDTVYRDDVGYEVITNVPLYRLYSLPGSLAPAAHIAGTPGSPRPTRAARRPSTSKVGYIARVRCRPIGDHPPRWRDRAVRSGVITACGSLGRSRLGPRPCWWPPGAAGGRGAGMVHPTAHPWSRRHVLVPVVAVGVRRAVAVGKGGRGGYRAVWSRRWRREYRLWSTTN